MKRRKVLEKLGMTIGNIGSFKVTL